MCIIYLVQISHSSGKKKFLISSTSFLLVTLHICGFEIFPGFSNPLKAGELWTKLLFLTTLKWTVLLLQPPCWLCIIILCCQGGRKRGGGRRERGEGRKLGRKKSNCPIPVSVEWNAVVLDGSQVGTGATWSLTLAAVFCDFSLNHLVVILGMVARSQTTHWDRFLRGVISLKTLVFFLDLNDATLRLRMWWAERSAQISLLRSWSSRISRRKVLGLFSPTFKSVFWLQCHRPHCSIHPGVGGAACRCCCRSSWTLSDGIGRVRGHVAGQHVCPGLLGQRGPETRHQPERGGRGVLRDQDRVVGQEHPLPAQELLRPGSTLKETAGVLSWGQKGPEQVPALRRSVHEGSPN